MRRALAAALALLVALPLANHGAALPAPAPPPEADPVLALLVRADPDGNRTLLLHVEDEPGGSYAYTAVRTPAQVPDVRETGAFVHAYARADGTPMIAAGAYVVSASGRGTLRVPLVLVEGAATTSELTASLLNLAAEGLQMGQLAAPFVTELLLPELADPFAAPPNPAGFSHFREFPTLYVWTVARRAPVGEVWAGLYLARTGHVEHDAQGQVARAVRDAELGAAARDGAGTQRLAGAYVEDLYEAATAPDGTAHANRVTAGLSTPAGRVPLAALQLDDARAGSDLAARPATQATSASVGVVVDGAYTPLVGARTQQDERPSQLGHEVTRVTSVGVFVEGAYVPLAGVGYHSDYGDVLEMLGPLAGDGPGSRFLTFEVDAGAFPDGAYHALVGAVVRPTFRDARYEAQTFVAAGPYTPLGFAPVVALTYDGNRPLLRWAFAYLQGNAANDVWLVAAGTTAAGTYVPVLGVQAVGRDPLGHRAQQQEVRVGTFLGSYRAWVPLASASYDADTTPAGHALLIALGGGPGSAAGDFDVRVGAYALGAYQPVAAVQYRSTWDGGEPSETAVVAGAYGPSGFVPLAGVVYEGAAPLGQSFGAPTNLADDRPWVATAGAFGPDGGFVPLLTVRRAPGSVSVTVGPALGL